ncbi:uncharacterized protein Dana_GF27930 [Drosophila ananassae]|uniref:Odorant-binding protein 57c n=1 Tax=Drosophila ananassae TaxID=7217 RepID=A0A0P8XMD5_DROAN|nr:general odorant-binding protein 57c [Drosophila ananassae]KPU75853.1 uncharacterized protein Dana_GF27930 [Drosophila ananassae]
MLKFLAIFITCTLVVLCQGHPAPVDYDNLITGCLTTNNISLVEFAEKINRSSSEEDDDEPVERKYKCFFHCVAERGDILDSGGYLDVEKLDEIESLDDHKREALYSCKKQHDDEEDGCEYAYKMVVCLEELLPLDDEEEITTIAN